MNNSHERFFNLSDDLCYVIDQQGIVQAINPAVTDVLGWSAVEVIGKPFVEFSHPEDQVTARTMVERLVREPGTSRLSTRYLSKEQSYQRISWKLHGDGDSMVAMGRPAPLRDQSESELDRFLRLCLDMVAIGEGLYFERINPSFTSILGWTQEELLTRPFVDLIHPDDREASIAAAAKLGQGHTTIHFENRFRAADGSYRWLQWTAAPDPVTNKLYGIARDITLDKELTRALERARDEAENAKAAVEETARLYQQILDAIEDMILVKSEKSRIIWANRAFREFYGMSNEELREIADAPFVEPDYTQQYIKDDLKVWTTREPLHIPEEPATRHDGQVLSFETLKSPIVDSQGNIKMTVGVSRDLARRKEAEALRRAKTEAELARNAAESANRAKSLFLASMSHELRTPLNAILGYAQLLERDSSLTIKQRENAETIRRSGEHLLTLISDILDLSKIEAGKLTITPGEFHLSDFIDSITDIFEMRARHERLAFSFQALSALPVALRADETRIRQVLINLLGNAIKFTNAGSVRLGVRWQEGKLYFEVADTGVGIDARDLELIFRPFEQLGNMAERASGVGLGLPISKQLVELMGGELKVTSNIGQGSVFWFEIPAEAVPDWKPPMPSIRMIEGYEGARKKILIVDDKPENRHALAQLLDGVGFDLVEAENGAQAIDKAMTERPDLILMDLVMPEMDGFEATRRLRAIESLDRTPIIAVSASVFDQVHERSRYAGCDGFVAKPVHVHDIINILAAQLGITWRYREQSALAAAQHQGSIEPGKPGESGEPGQAAAGPRPSTLTRDELLAMHRAACIGDIQAIVHIIETRFSAEELASTDQSQPPIEVALYRLAKRFQTRQIRETLEHLLQAES